MRRLQSAAVVVALVVAACGAANADGPPDIIYGRDICVQCNMIITEIGHGAAYRLDDGVEKKFDGIGEMILHGRAEQEFSRAEPWVHDYWSEEWIRAEDAFYVPTRAVSSPMGHGIFGFSDRERAIEFAAEVGGQVIDWETALQLPIVDGLLGGHHASDDATGDETVHGDGVDDTAMGDNDHIDGHETEGDT